MDYEKLYKEALERAKGMWEQGMMPERIEYIFPELKESEDEKIRKALIEMVHDTTGDTLWIDYNVHKEDAIAWLEKQGEQKVYPTVPKEKIKLTEDDNYICLTDAPDYKIVDNRYMKEIPIVQTDNIKVELTEDGNFVSHTNTPTYYKDSISSKDYSEFTTPTTE